MAASTAETMAAIKVMFAPVSRNTALSDINANFMMSAAVSCARELSDSVSFGSLPPWAIGLPSILLLSVRTQQLLAMMYDKPTYFADGRSVIVGLGADVGMGVGEIT